MLHGREFHILEMSLALYTLLKARGDCPFIGLPVALSHFFRHSGIFIRTDAGITRPEELKGKRVGLPDYASTTAVFQKGLLQHEYGVTPQDVLWFRGGEEQPGRRPVVPYALPPAIRLEDIPPDRTLSGMLEEGELDALCAILLPEPFLRGSTRIARLFPDYKEVEVDYYCRTGIFPIMHIVVVHEEVYREHPWIARSLYEAFCRAKDLAINSLYDTDALRVPSHDSSTT